MSRAKLSKQIALVTGANKGIGYAICERLIKEHANSIGVLLVGAREELRGQNAIESLSKLKDSKSNDEPVLKYIHIDIDDEKSIKQAAQKIRTDYGGLNILINNAAMAFKGDAFDENVASTTVRCNYTGTKYMIEHFLPILSTKPDSRIVTVSSTVGRSSLKKMSSELQSAFLKKDLTLPELDALMNRFVTDVREGTYANQGWPKSAYGVSKTGVNMLTRIYARDLKAICSGWRTQTKETVHEPTINCCCPGYVKTDMTSQRGVLAPWEGADTPVWLATTARSDKKASSSDDVVPSDAKFHGQFFYQRQSQSWM